MADEGTFMYDRVLYKLTALVITCNESRCMNVHLPVKIPNIAIVLSLMKLNEGSVYLAYHAVYFSV